MTSELPIDIREGRKSDHNYVKGTWIASFRKGCRELSGTMAADLFEIGWQRLMAHLLATCDLHIACPDDAQEQILGWLLTERIGAERVVHYAFVKGAGHGTGTFAHKGIATTLLTHLGLAGTTFRYTHRTEVSASIAAHWFRAHGLTLRYDPTILFGLES